MSTSMPKGSKSGPSEVWMPVKHGRACMSCRSLKIRYEGEQPICGLCGTHLKDDEGEYADGPERPKLLQDTVSLLEARLLGSENHCAPDIILNSTHQSGGSSESNSLRVLLASIPSREGDVESATGSRLEGSHDVPALNILDVVIPDSRENDSPISSVSDSAWNRRALELLTMYRELSAARVPEEFAPLRMRFQQELTFNGGVLVALAGTNAAMFAITPDSVFKINSHAYNAVATSSTACGLGIACDVWFLLRYGWVELETFIYRSRDVYNSYVFFSLSSRIPTFCMLLSAISLMAFLGLVAYDVWPIGVLVIGVLVVLLMALQFIVYGMHQFAASALRAWRAGMGSMGTIVAYFRSLAGGGL